ncbi:hypothetical protein [Nocardia abscessus]|uniref:hypothetical protein n=1 Tax=Nocardia abscessus TaxID=120957 RepID=UPI0005BE07A0|nr:hypothetical protein [Nocardia abscessus]MCC3330935.1 hypothetical protein [Nocardia abscessus]
MRSPNYIDFLADTACAGSILGIHSGASIDEVNRSIGSGGFVDNIDKKQRSLVRDYGLMEFGFQRDSSNEWQCWSAIIQVHRLQYETTIPQPILRVYGSFPEEINISELDSALRNRGADLDEIEMNMTGYRYYRISRSDARVIVSHDNNQLDSEDMIWSISPWWIG